MNINTNTIHNRNRNTAAMWPSQLSEDTNICNVEESGIIIPGSTANSDHLSASVAFIKNKLRAKLQANQKTGSVTEW